MSYNVSVCHHIIVLSLSLKWIEMQSTYGRNVQTRRATETINCETKGLF